MTQQIHKIHPFDTAKKALTLREKVGQLFMPAAFINDTEEEIQKIEYLITKCGIGSICFFHSRASAATNFEGKKEVLYNSKSLDRLKHLIRRYQAVSKYPLLIAIDAEWGLAMRIEETPQYPYALTLGAIQDDSLIEKVGKSIGQDCKEAGIHWNLCPAVDINNNPNNPVIGYRSFGDSPALVYQKAKAFIDGMDKSGVLNSIKHFPGHGDTAVDSHLGLPKIDKSKDELLANELYPFKKLIAEGVDSVMVGHLSVPSIGKHKTRSSTLSKPIITELLRNEFHHTGIVITDALNMHSVSKLYSEKGQLEWEAFEAGNDVLCFAENTEEGIEAILNHAHTQQVEDSFERVWKLKEKAFSNQSLEQDTLNYDTLMLQLAQSSLTLLKGNENNIRELYSSGFDLVEIGNKNVTTFSSELKGHEVDTNTKIIAIYPPEMKPTGNFGLEVSDIDHVNRLLNSNDCTLYVFGNPYAVRLFDHKKAKAIILAYQNFEVFQENAAEHIKGNIVVRGKSPVTIHTY